MNAKNWYVCNKCGKTLSSYKCLWRHKKSCQSTGHNSEIPRQQHAAADRKRSEKEQKRENKSKVFEQLRAADTSPLDFHFVGEEQTNKEKGDELSDGSSTEEESQNREYAMSDTDEEQVKEEESIIGNLIDESSAAEDDDDVIMDAGVWHSIAFHAEENAGLLVSFKFFFQLAEAVDHDATIKKVMDTVCAIRDDDVIGFKEALDHALEKRKFLIWKTLKDNAAADKVEHFNVWKMISSEMKEHTLDEAFRILRCYILLSRSIKRDEIFHSVKEMIEECEDDIDPMSHDEALSYAIDQKRSVIVEAAQRAVAGSKHNASSSSVHTSDDGSSGEDD
jgi:hypothetical protein